MIARKLRITGRVQGVGYRDALRGEAKRHGVGGWVRNRRDGSVEALLQGEPARVEALIAWARRGPRAARVDAVNVEQVPAAEGGRDACFEQLPTE
ncbi:MAG TPA: acylphosphatase [Burkholderiales bacterium]|nr:acylphosphatase [Burkholderiales bacterium]